MSAQRKSVKEFGAHFVHDEAENLPTAEKRLNTSPSRNPQKEEKSLDAV
jgi:hypothetical protein